VDTWNVEEEKETKRLRIIPIFQYFIGEGGYSGGRGS